jgi:hypothetical protein
MAKMVWAFDIKAESTSVDTDVHTAYSNGFLTAPLKFPVNFVPRSEKHAAVIRSEFEEAKAFLARFES